MMAALGLLIAVVHLYFLWSLGAGFYYDSIIYAQLGEAFLQDGGLRDFYTGPRFYVFQHLAPGLPLLWEMACLLTEDYAWLLFSGIQHAIAACSLFYLALVLRPFLAPPLIVISVILVVANPLYESLHSRLMTESVTGSMLLCGLAATTSLLLQRTDSKTPFMILAVSGIVATLVRSQSVLYFAMFLLAIVLQTRERVSRAAPVLCMGVLLLSALVWPAYRYLVIGEWFLPNTSFLALSHALRFNTNPSEDAVGYLKNLSLPATLPSERLVEQGMDYDEAAEVGSHLRANGLDVAAAKQYVSDAAWVVRTDSPEVAWNQLRVALLSIGMHYPIFLGGDTTVVHRGFTTARFSSHVAYWNQWEAGTVMENYAGELATILQWAKDRPGLYDSGAAERFAKRIRPFVVDRALWLRDPLWLQHVPSDIWLLGWIGTMAVWCRSHRLIVGLLVTLVLATYVMSLSVPVGNARYSYPLAPIYTIGCVIGLNSVRSLISRQVRRWSMTKCP